MSTIKEAELRGFYLRAWKRMLGHSKGGIKDTYLFKTKLFNMSVVHKKL